MSNEPAVETYPNMSIMYVPVTMANGSFLLSALLTFVGFSVIPSSCLITSPTFTAVKHGGRRSPPSSLVPSPFKKKKIQINHEHAQVQRSEDPRPRAQAFQPDGKERNLLLPRAPQRQ